MLVWGRARHGGSYLGDGALKPGGPISGSKTAPRARAARLSLRRLERKQMICLGFEQRDEYFNDGGQYNPSPTHGAR